MAALKIRLPARYSVAVSRSRSTTRRVRTTDRPPSAERGTHPVVLFGRTGSRTRVHTRPRASVARPIVSDDVRGLLGRSGRKERHLGRVRSGDARSRDRPQDGRPVGEVALLPRAATGFCTRRAGAGRAASDALRPCRRARRHPRLPKTRDPEHDGEGDRRRPSAAEGSAGESRPSFAPASSAARR